MALTVKKRKFAMRVAATGNNTQAYSEVYGGNGKNKRTTHKADGYKLAKEPEVAAEIERLTQREITRLESRLPSSTDGKAIQLYALQKMFDLAENDENGAVKFRAAEWLHQYGTHVIQAHEVQTIAEEQPEFAALRKLFRKSGIKSPFERKRAAQPILDLEANYEGVLPQSSPSPANSADDSPGRSPDEPAVEFRNDSSGNGDSPESPDQ